MISLKRGVIMAVKSIDDMTKKELQEHYIKEREAMFRRIQEMDNKLNELQNIIRNQEVDINDLKLELAIAQEKLKQSIAAKYQSQKNQVIIDMPTLFGDVEEEALKVEETENEEVITVGEHQRKRKTKEKHVNYDNLDHKIVTLPVPDGEDVCEICGAKMHIKKYEERKELVYVPSKMYVRVTRIPVLECVECQSVNEEGKSSYKIVSHANPVYPRSMVSPELLAYIIDMKYNNGLPLYTIERIFERQNVIISRQNMANWIIRSLQYLDPIYELMKEDLINTMVLHADETPTQVLNEEGKASTSTSYMFVYRSNKYEKPIVLYDYRASRSGDGPKEFLQGYTGYTVTDAYDGYNKVGGTIRCMCNVHALRKFKDSYKLLPNTNERTTSDEAMAIKKYDKIFHMEHKIEEDSMKEKNLTKRIEYIQKMREEKLKPLFVKFFAWLEEIQLKHAGKHSMSQAISYALNHQVELMRCIDNGYIPLDNSSCERSIRPFVLIRNRCKFYVSPKGADASAKIYSLVITCIENRINPYMYFTHLFENLPNMDLTDKAALRQLLPYSESLPDYTRILTKKEIKAILSEQG